MRKRSALYRRTCRIRTSACNY